MKILTTFYFYDSVKFVSKFKLFGEEQWLDNRYGEFNTKYLAFKEGRFLVAILSRLSFAFVHVAMYIVLRVYKWLFCLLENQVDFFIFNMAANLRRLYLC